MKPLLNREEFVLLLLTATVYTSFLVSEMGYADHYQLPHELIATTHIGLVLSIKSIMYGVLVYIGKIQLIWAFTPSGKSHTETLIRVCVALSLLVGFAMLPYLETDLSYAWYFSFVGLMIFYFFIFPLLSQRKIVGFGNKLSAQSDIDRRAQNIYASLVSPIGRETLVLTGYIIAVFFFAYGDGRKKAIEQEIYSIKLNDPNVALLRIYGDLAVFVLIDRKNQKLTGNVRIEKISDSKTLEFAPTNIGRLTKFDPPKKIVVSPKVPASTSAPASATVTATASATGSIPVASK